MQSVTYRWLLQHVNDLIIILSHSGAIIDISAAAARLYGWDVTSTIGANFFTKLTQQRIAPPIKIATLDDLTTQPLTVIQTLIAPADRQPHIIEWSLAALPADTHEQASYFFLGKDNTQQRHAEQEAKSIKLNLQHIVACMPGNVYWMDKNLIYLGCNENAAKLINLKPEDVIGKTYEDFARIGNWNKEAIDAFKRDDQEVIVTGLPKINIEDPPLKNMDGSLVYYLTSRVPIKNERNEVIGLVGISIDITERKKMEVALLEAKEKSEAINREKLQLLEQLSHEVIGDSAKKYERIEQYAYSIRHYLLNIIHLMPGNVYWLDRNLIYLGCNKNVADHIGLKEPEDIIGKTYSDFVASGYLKKEEAELFKKDDLEVITTGLPKLNVEEPPVQDSDGKLIHFLTNRVPLRDENGEVTGVVGISVDITELKNTQAQLQQAEVRIESMISLSASIAHELRTPLSAIQAGVKGALEYFPTLVTGYELAKQHGLGVEPIRSQHLQTLSRIFTTIQSETRYSNTIIDMILMNVKQSHVASGDFELYSMDACIKEALSRYPLKREEEGLIHYQEAPDRDFLFKGDQTLLVHVFFNLLKNALYYIQAARKGEITIWLGADADYNIVYIKDTAQGIPADVLPKLFERFYTTTRHGTGLGLAYCKMVMTGFGGDIVCTSVYGEYAQFALLFPKLKDAP